MLNISHSNLLCLTSKAFIVFKVIHILYSKFCFVNWLALAAKAPTVNYMTYNLQDPIFELKRLPCVSEFNSNTLIYFQFLVIQPHSIIGKILELCIDTFAYNLVAMLTLLCLYNICQHKMNNTEWTTNVLSRNNIGFGYLSPLPYF